MSDTSALDLLYNQVSFLMALITFLYFPLFLHVFICPLLIAWYQQFSTWKQICSNHQTCHFWAFLQCDLRALNRDAAELWKHFHGRRGETHFLVAVQQFLMPFPLRASDGFGWHPTPLHRMQWRANCNHPERCRLLFPWTALFIFLS